MENLVDRRFDGIMLVGDSVVVFSDADLTFLHRPNEELYDLLKDTFTTRDGQCF